VKEKVLGNIRIQQVNAARFQQVQQLGHGTSWDEFSMWVEEVWTQWTRHKSKGVMKKETRRRKSIQNLGDVDLEDDQHPMKFGITVILFPTLLKTSPYSQPNVRKRNRWN